MEHLQDCQRLTYLPSFTSLNDAYSDNDTGVSQIVSQESLTTNVKMGYPDTFEGYMIGDQKKWTDFKKQEVCHLLEALNNH